MNKKKIGQKNIKNATFREKHNKKVLTREQEVKTENN